MAEYVPIYVPEVHYRDMVGHLVSLISQTRVESPTPDTEKAEQSDPAWNDEVWENVWPAVKEGARKLMVVLAEHPDEWVPITVLNDSLGSSTAVQGSLSSLTKQMKKRGLADWPFEVTTDDQTGRATYRMDVAIATIVLRLARTAS
jgi:hypothetical protein